LESHSLYRKSIQIIKQNQAPTGAYIASPNFKNYAYAWLRDGSFTAYAMDCVGEHDSAQRFYLWVGDVIKRHASKLAHIERSLAERKPLEDRDFFHTRYTLQGVEELQDDGWGKFQLDGYGTWLWSLARHVDLTGDSLLLQSVAESVELTIRYISAVYKLPNYDLWEENPTFLHVYTLGAVYGGLASIANTSGVASSAAASAIQTACQVSNFILQYGLLDGRLVKLIRPQPGNSPSFAGVFEAGVDASLVGLSTPYDLLAHNHPGMQATIDQIERDLHRKEGGVYRYLADTYFGGGEWLLLAGWLGWHYARNGNVERALQLLRWIESQACADGNLPEQVSSRLLAPEHFSLWENKWGPVANPLLWSHAMYLILYREFYKI